MDFDTQAYLQSKFFGQPFMPTSFTQLTFVAQVYCKNWYHELTPYNAITQLCTLVILLRLLSYVYGLVSLVYGYGVVRSLQLAKHRIGSRLFKFILSLPPLKKKVDLEVGATTLKIEEELMQNSSELIQFSQLPASGLSHQEVTAQLDSLHNSLKGTDWANGRVSGAVYHGGDSLLELQTEAYHKNSVANQLHPDVFPGVRKMEAEVVSMVLKIFNGPEESCGCTTSGGTESLLLTGLAARQYGRKYGGVTGTPEIIAPVTIHAGIEKACYYFGMKLHKVELDPVTYKVNLSTVKRLINRNTVLLVGSAPNFPHGIIDDIEGLGKLATKYNIPLHVDACLGSFIVSFLEKSGVHGKDTKIPKFDFRVPGVTSISCDTHKYGFAPKGSSIIMYRSSKLRECQYYISTDWTGGMYGSPTLAGSRPGAIMAGCWATLVTIGEEGYKKSCFEIVQASMKLKRTITEKILALEVIGDPIGSVVAFKITDKFAKVLDIYELGDSLTKKGWHFSTLQSPAALHFALTRLTVPIIDELIRDLEQTVDEKVKEAQSQPEKESKKPKSELGALYGVAGSVQTAGVADRLIVAFLNTLYKVDQPKKSGV
ncbi:sphingosine-1-phosphate lyase [[Candida] railenensis]|uniref:sphinganine-1-phosphate aldolase n=1 Tax=[Candida] railenensis TaxID=45579 RepID=A0A9P0VYG9_9ASCO|nr:sphingosine-1-phosphate lyase [[Candida] railenensis]